jgi:hypothetical protein
MTIWETILATAVHTPSPHNTQPWRVRILDDRRATLFIERARLLPDEDTTGHFQRCAMGMFLESLRIISANAGFTLRDSLLDGGAAQPFIPFADLELQSGGAPSEYPDELLRKRMTSRLASNGMRMAPEVTAELKQFQPQYGQRYFQIDDPELIEKLVGINIAAVFKDLNSPKYHDEVARWFRSTDAEARATNDGLDYRCMHLKPREMKLMKNLPQVMRWPITRGAFRRIYRGRLGLVTHIGAVSGAFFEDAAALRAGAYLIRFWLELARRDLYIHPFGNLVTNPEAKARVRELTGIDDIWLIFRIGHTAEPPRRHSRSVREVLLDV